jgi:hypothetical protein
MTRRIAVALVLGIAPAHAAEWPDFIPPEPIAFEVLVHGLPLPPDAWHQVQFNSNAVNGDLFCMRDRSCRYILSVVDPNLCATIQICKAQMDIDYQALQRLSERERACRLDEHCVSAVAAARGLK